MADTSSEALHPTLWRTCRVLANRLRLKMLRELLHHPDQSVSSVAGRVGVPLTMASQYLRALNARGLLKAKRKGKWVYYRPCGDPCIPGTTILLRAIKQTFSEQKYPVETIFHLATAFTHPRRLDIFRVLLVEGPLDASGLRLRIEISRSAMSRHLNKLIRRGFVWFDGMRYVSICPKGPLSKALLHIVRNQ